MRDSSAQAEQSGGFSPATHVQGAPVRAMHAEQSASVQQQERQRRGVFSVLLM